MSPRVTRRQFVLAGAAAYLTKPLNEAQLFKIIAHITRPDPGPQEKKGMMVFTHEAGTRLLSR